MAKNPVSGNQGEGDRESARRYNRRTREHVARMSPAQLRPDQTTQSEAEGSEARKAARARSRAGGQDLRDAAVFRALERRRKP